MSQTRNIGQQQPPIVLLVEDCLEDRETIKRYLLAERKDNYTIFEASTAEEGLDLYQRCQPDVVLLDYRLPDSDGLEFLEQIQQEGSENHPPIILLTGQGNEQVAVAAMKAGICDYLVKGQVTPQELRAAVNRAIETAQLRAQLRQAQAERQRQTEQEKLVAQIANQIHSRSDIDEILGTTVSQVRQFLGCDRVFIYRFEPDWSGIVVAESVGDGWLPILNVQVEDSYFVETRGEDYRTGRIQAVADIHNANLTDCHIELLARFQIRANLAVPINIASYMPTGRFAGLSDKHWQKLIITVKLLAISERLPRSAIANAPNNACANRRSFCDWGCKSRVLPLPNSITHRIPSRSRRKPPRYTA
jgi:DNA-binding response OmpR family regulator